MSEQKENKRCLFRGFYPNEDGKTTIKVTLIGHDEPFTFKGDWIYGIPFSRIGGGLNPMGISAIRRDDNDCICTVVAETVGQWVTYDKNGNDVFIGDRVIVQTSNNGYSPYRRECEMDWNEKMLECLSDVPCKGDMDYIELIGNLWEVEQ